MSEASNTPEPGNSAADPNDGVKSENEISDEGLEQVSGGNWFARKVVVQKPQPRKIHYIDDEANGSAGQ
jgi:hypothetical protein